MNKYIDHTLLRADAKKDEIKQLCNEAVDYNFKAVCVNPSWVEFCKSELKESDVLVCTVIGFPLGANTTQVKVFETKDAISKGADEIDMVINIGKLKDRDYDYVLDDIKAVVEAAEDKVVKVIIETALLSDSEIIKVSNLCVEAKADFVKTSTGFSTSGANVRVVDLIKQTVGDKALIKAAGGVRSEDDLKAMIKVGANRIGTSSGTKLISKKEK